MRTQAQSPQFLAEVCCFFFEKTRQLDLESFNVRKTGILEKIEAKLYYNIVLRAKNLRDLAGNPLLHDLHVNLLHVHFLAKFWRKLCPLQELLVHSLGHVDGGRD